MVKQAINKRFRGARRVGSVLPAAAKKVFRQYGFAEEALIRQWHEIAGPKLAPLTLPLKLTYGKEKSEKVATLHLLVESAAAPQVQYQNQPPDISLSILWCPAAGTVWSQ